MAAVEGWAGWGMGTVHSLGTVPACHLACPLLPPALPGRRWPRRLASLSTMLKRLFNLKLRAWLKRDGGRESEGEDVESL